MCNEVKAIDAVGVEVHVGDSVAYATTNNKSGTLRLGRVEEIVGKSVRTSPLNGGKPNRMYARNCVIYKKGEGDGEGTDYC